MGKTIDITNQRFGRLIALYPVGSTPQSQGKTCWFCQCDCGQTHVVVNTSLRRGLTHSCGCQGGKYRHGYSKVKNTHPLYRTWVNLRRRCSNPNTPSYKWYGAQGVRFDRHWDDFTIFLTDVGERPHPSLTLDRYPDKNGNYERGNVRWATHKEQANNRRPYPKNRKSRRK